MEVCMYVKDVGVQCYHIYTLLHLVFHRKNFHCKHSVRPWEFNKTEQILASFWKKKFKNIVKKQGKLLKNVSNIRKSIINLIKIQKHKYYYILSVWNSDKIIKFFIFMYNCTYVPRITHTYTHTFHFDGIFILHIVSLF